MGGWHSIRACHRATEALETLLVVPVRLRRQAWAPRPASKNPLTST